MACYSDILWTCKGTAVPVHVIGKCGNGGISPYIRKPRHYTEVSGELYVPAALPLGAVSSVPTD